MIVRSLDIQFLLRAESLASLIRCTRHSPQSRVRLQLGGTSVRVCSSRYTASSTLRCLQARRLPLAVQSGQAKRRVPERRSLSRSQRLLFVCAHIFEPAAQASRPREPYSFANMASAKKTGAAIRRSKGLLGRRIGSCTNRCLFFGRSPPTAPALSKFDPSPFNDRAHQQPEICPFQSKPGDQTPLPSVRFP